MDVTIMGSTTSLIKQLKSANLTTPNGETISYKQGDGFMWDPNRFCLHYNPRAPQAPQLTLHELGHALLGHKNYAHDITLLELERAAWDKALEIGKTYGIAITDDAIENHLDTYRDWLHARSLCPACQTTGLQTGNRQYCCPSCGQIWQVNDARTCGLKRYITK